jgi:hypothetical protein
MGDDRGEGGGEGRERRENGAIYHVECPNQTQKKKKHKDGCHLSQCRVSDREEIKKKKRKLLQENYEENSKLQILYLASSF